MNYFVILLIIILLVIYYTGFIKNVDKFVSGYDPREIRNEPVNYNTRKQNCDELTYSPQECIVNTVIPSNKVVCEKSFSPITNNEINYIEEKYKKSKNPTLSLKYDFDLLSSFNNAQINNDELSRVNDLETEVRSLNSIENNN
jgi:hypothetical protein